MLHHLLPAILPVAFFAITALLVLGLSKLNKNIPFRWANVFKLNLTLLFLLVGIFGHIIYPDNLLSLIPEFFPYRLESIYASGVLEVIFAILLWTPLQRVTGNIIIAYLILVIPFNIYGWTIAENTPNYVDDPYYLWIRVPMQILFIAFAYFGTRSSKISDPAGQTA